MKKNFFLLAMACFYFSPITSHAEPLQLEPYTTDQLVEHFGTKRVIEYDPKDVLPSSSTNHFLIFSNDTVAKSTISLFKKKPHAQIKTLPLKDLLSNQHGASLKDTFLSFHACNVVDASLDVELRQFVSSGGVVRIIEVFSEPKGGEYIKSAYKTMTSHDPAISFVISGDSMLLYSNTYHSIEISPLLEACTESYLESSENENILRIEKTILSSITSKELSIFECIEKSHIDADNTVPLYPLLWKGLFYLEQKEYLEASRCFHKALSSGIDHWRVYWYISLAETERRNFSEAKRALRHVLQEVPHFQDAKKLLTKIEET